MPRWISDEGNRAKGLDCCEGLRCVTKEIDVVLRGEDAVRYAAISCGRGRLGQHMFRLLA